LGRGLVEELRWPGLAAVDDRQSLASADSLIDAASLVPLPPARRRLVRAGWPAGALSPREAGV